MTTQEERKKKRLEKLKKNSLWGIPLIIVAATLTLIAWQFPPVWNEWLWGKNLIWIIALWTAVILVLVHGQEWTGKVGATLIILFAILTTLPLGSPIWSEIEQRAMAKELKDARTPNPTKEGVNPWACTADNWFDCPVIPIPLEAKSLQIDVRDGPIKLKTIVPPPYLEEEIEFWPGQKLDLKYPARAFKIRSLNGKEVMVKFEYILDPKKP